MELGEQGGPAPELLLLLLLQELRGLSDLQVRRAIVGNGKFLREMALVLIGTKAFSDHDHFQSIKYRVTPDQWSYSSSKNNVCKWQLRGLNKLQRD